MFEIIKNRISLPMYMVAYFVNCTISTWYWIQTGANPLVLAFFMVIVLLNHFMLVIGLTSLLDALKSQEKPSVARILITLLGKTFLLAGGFFLVLRLAPENIYMSLLVYIFQLIILFISIKKKASILKN